MREKANDIKKVVEIAQSLDRKSLNGFSKTRTKELLIKWVESEYKYNKKYGDSNEKISNTLNQYYLNQDYLVSILKTLKEIKKALIQGKLVLSCKSNSGLDWDIHYLNKNELTNISAIIKQMLCSYPLNKDTHYYKVACYGTSRPLEIILAYGYSLGLNFHDIRQSQKII